MPLRRDGDALDVLMEQREETNSRVCHIKVHDVPSADEMRRVAAFMTMELTRTPFVIHAEHVTRRATRMPSVEQIQTIVSLLVEGKLLIRERLLGTVIQTQGLDDCARLARDAFLLLYRPHKPFAVTENVAETASFLKAL